MSIVSTPLDDAILYSAAAATVLYAKHSKMSSSSSNGGAPLFTGPGSISYLQAGAPINTKQGDNVFVKRSVDMSKPQGLNANLQISSHNGNIHRASHLSKDNYEREWNKTTLNKRPNVSRSDQYEMNKRCNKPLNYHDCR